MFTEEVRPYVSELAPKATYKQKFKLPLPISLENPYVDDDLADSFEATTIEFVVGYYIVEGEHRLMPCELSGVPLKSISGVPAFGAGQLSLSKTFEDQKLVVIPRNHFNHQ